MRISEHDLNVIKEFFTKSFWENDQLWLFGPRADDNQKGGDIDLYIETNHHDMEMIIERKISFLAAVKMKIGDQRIDVVLNRLKSALDLPIYQEARETGIRLI